MLLFYSGRNKPRNILNKIHHLLAKIVIFLKRRTTDLCIRFYR